MCKRSHRALVSDHDSIVVTEKYHARFHAMETRALEMISTRAKCGRILACYVCGSLAGVVVVHKKHVMWGNFDPANGDFTFELVSGRSHGLSENDVRLICNAGKYDKVVFKPVEVSHA